MLEIKNGSKSFHQGVILKDINLVFSSGHIYGLKGDNGSGKTLLLKLLAGYIRLDKGQVLQDGQVYGTKGHYIQNAGLLIDTVSFLPHLTLRENLQLLLHFSSKIKKESIDKWIAIYSLQEFEQVKYCHLSLGTKQKMALIQAFIHEPEILLLDEPMNALDQASVAITKQIILSYLKKEKGLVILTSHISENISDLCSHCFWVGDKTCQPMRESSR